MDDGAPEIPGEEFHDPERENSVLGSDDGYQEEEEGPARGQEEGDEEDGEDLLENMAGDYRAMPELDRYDARDIDDEVAEESFGAREEARLRAEAVMDREQGQRGVRRPRLPDALLEDEDAPRTQRRRLATQEAEEAGDGIGDLPQDLSEGAVRGMQRDWVQQEPIQRAIGRVFMAFLENFRHEEGDPVPVYEQRVSALGANNLQSLEVDFGDLLQTPATKRLAGLLIDEPKVLLEIFNQVATEFACRKFAEFTNLHAGVLVRITKFPVEDSIRDLRHAHLNRMVNITGVVTRRTGVFPQLQQVKFDCSKCGFVLGPYFQSSETEIKPNACLNCQAKGPFTVNVQQTLYRNFQKLTLQEAPGSVMAGRLPRQKEVILLHDLIDAARPGEIVSVTGVYTHSYSPLLNIKNAFPVFSTLVEANSVGKAADAFAAASLTSDEKEQIEELARDPSIGDRICRSIAPSIYGHLNIKTALALALFGGQAKQPSGAHRLRGDLNVLLLGDPGVAKSQFLKYVEKVAQRAIYTTGKGASAVGLTAAVQKDPVTREWTLEGGALVLADRGVCLIDEFDKMNDQDRVSIHEAMEQQSISISKAGIVTSLQARCSVIAAANPIGGRYEPSRTFAENVELTDPILSRFDVLCVVRDVVDPAADARLAAFVVASHQRAHPLRREALEAAAEAQAEGEASEEQQQLLREAAKGAGQAAPLGADKVLPQEVLRKYITYAKQNCHPRMQNADTDKIAAVYAELRRESALSHGMPIAVRHLESIVRMSEAFARMHLRSEVSEDDVNRAISVLLDSFIGTQKLSVQKALQRKFRRFTSYRQDHTAQLMHLLQALVRDAAVRAKLLGQPREDWDEEERGARVTVPVKTLQQRAKEEANISDVTFLFSSASFAEANFRLDEDRQNICVC